jgi:Transglycosylase SLT domain
MWHPAMFAAWVIQPMTTMIRKCRTLVAASLLTAVIMSFPIATTSEAMVQRDQLRVVTTRICPIDWRRSAWHVKKLIRCAATAHGVSPDKALYIAWRESRYRPSAYNAAGGAAGIYQHLLKYWPDRAADYGFRDLSAFNARANIMVTMRMVKQYGWAPWAL